MPKRRSNSVRDKSVKPVAKPTPVIQVQENEVSAPAEVPEYVAPKPYHGEIVLYFRGLDTPRESAVPSIVLGIGKTVRSVNLSIQNKMYNQVEKGIRHISDPDSSKESVREKGFWDFTEEGYKRRGLKYPG